MMNVKIIAIHKIVSHACSAKKVCGFFSRREIEKIISNISNPITKYKKDTCHMWGRQEDFFFFSFFGT